MDYRISSITDYNDLEFKNAFISYFKEIGIEIKENSELWNKMSRTTEVECYAIRNANQIIGFIMFQNEQFNSSTYFFNESVGYIRELYVRKEFRNMGFGKKLINIAEDYFKKKSVHKLILTYENTALSFYEKIGFLEDKSYTAKNHQNIVVKML